MSPTHTNLCSWGPWSEACPLQASFLGGGGGGEPCQELIQLWPCGSHTACLSRALPVLSALPALSMWCPLHPPGALLPPENTQGLHFSGRRWGGWGRAGMTVAEEGRREEAEKQRVI